jgi:hypothetical protein
MPEILNEVEETVIWRGHKLTSWEQYGRNNYLASCIKCNAIARVNLNPLPNETEVSGKAVALECTK